uniref:Uncharacterized protein n=1 Tax=Homalodisca liturata TaxID=320908 RepID=A0A1B6IFH5_9HEMI
MWYWSPNVYCTLNVITLMSDFLHFTTSTSLIKLLTRNGSLLYKYVILSPDEVMTGAQQHDYNTLHTANYHLPAHRLASTEKKPTYVGAKLWHALPLELKRRDRLQFGHKLKLWLQDHPFYTINEFLNCTVL